MAELTIRLTDEEYRFLSAVSWREGKLPAPWATRELMILVYERYMQQGETQCQPTNLT
jgi:hypothetical protein